MSENICYSCSQIKDAHCLDYESTCIDCRAKELEIQDRILEEEKVRDYGFDDRGET